MKRYERLLRLHIPLLFTIVFILTNSAVLSLSAQSTLPERPSGFVTDEVGIFTITERTTLENRLSAFRDSTSNVIAIAILKDLRGLPREEVASELFNSWRMWDDERYNGVLILAALEDRQLQIEVGYGLEGAIPDALAGRIVQDVLRPAFRQEVYFDGLSEAVSILMAASAGEFKGIGEEESNSRSSIVVFVIFLALVIGIEVIRAISRAQKGHTIGSSGIYGSRRDQLVTDSIWIGGIGSMGGSSRGRGSGSFSSGGFSSGGSFGGSGGFGSGGAGAGGGW